jgi:hypothetical protein
MSHTYGFPPPNPPRAHCQNARKLAVIAQMTEAAVIKKEQRLIEEQARIKYDEEQKIIREKLQKHKDLLLAEEKRLQDMQDDVYPDLILRFIIRFDGLVDYCTEDIILRTAMSDRDYERLMYEDEKMTGYYQSINKMLRKASVQTYVEYPLPKIFGKYISSEDFTEIEIPLTDENLCQIYLHRIPDIDFVSLYVSDPNIFTVVSAKIIKN